MPKQVTMYRDEKSGRFVKGKKPKLDDFWIDSSKQVDADALVQGAIKEYLQENAEIVEGEPEPTPTGFDIINFLMDVTVKAFACLLFFVAAMYLGVRV